MQPCSCTCSCCMENSSIFMQTWPAALLYTTSWLPAIVPSLPASLLTFSAHYLLPFPLCCLWCFSLPCAQSPNLLLTCLSLASFYFLYSFCKRQVFAWRVPSSACGGWDLPCLWCRCDSGRLCSSVRLRGWRASIRWRKRSVGV